MPTHVFGALQCGPIWTSGGLYKIKIQRGGGIFNERMVSHVSRAPFLLTFFFAQMDAKKIWPKRMKGGRVIRLFIVHKVTEPQHIHSLYGCFYAHFNKFPYSLCLKGNGINIFTMNQKSKAFRK